METRNEIWKDIEGYEGYYQVSNFGRVKILDRYLVKKSRYGGTYRQLYKGCYMKIQINKKGYTYVILSKGDVPRTHYIHRLVAKAFVPGYHEGLAVNHIDENKENNVPSNLEWVSYKKNNSHGTRLERIAAKHRKPVIQMTIDGEIVKRYDSAAQASKITGIRFGNISSACYGRYGCKTAGGYRWRFAED